MKAKNNCPIQEKVDWLGLKPSLIIYSIVHFLSPILILPYCKSFLALNPDIFGEPKKWTNQMFNIKLSCNVLPIIQKLINSFKLTS